MMTGKTLRLLKNKLEKKGFIIHSGFSLRIPENYTLYIQKNWTDNDAPSLKEIQKINKYIDQINSSIKAISTSNMESDYQYDFKKTKFYTIYKSL